MTRIMAFDYGTKRLGIAVTDPLGIIATGLTAIHPKDALIFISNYLQKEKIDIFVLGYPKQLDGTDSQNAQHVKGFATLLKKNFSQIPVSFVDERFTSKMAHQVLLQNTTKKSSRQDKGKIDTIAATLILQHYMEIINNQYDK